MDAWKLIREDKIEYYKMMMVLMPLARTAMSKEGGNALRDYARKVERQLDASIPWVKRGARISSAVRGKVAAGKTVVVLDKGERADNEIFKDAEITRGQ